MSGRVEMTGELEVTPSKEAKEESSDATTEPPSGKPQVRFRRTRGASVAINRYDINYGIPSRKSVHDFVILEHGEESWRTKVHDFLKQSWVEYTLLGLLICDIFIIFTEMFLMIEFPYCGIIERDCLACCPYETDVADQNERWLAESYCPSGYDVTGEAGCDPHKYETIHTFETVLFSFTIVILCIFFTEISLEMAVLGVKKFFSQLFLALDFFIVSISLIFELVFFAYKSQIQKVFAVLVVFRIWRFVRVGHALMEVTSELTGQEYEDVFEYVTECEKRMKAHKIGLPPKSDTVHGMLEDHIGHDHH